MKYFRHILASIVAWFVASALLLRRFRGIFVLDSEHQKLMYYSESAFYLSFYYDVVEAPSWTALYTGLTNDDRTEFPQVVTSFKRLNIMQEIALGSIYRLFNLKTVIKNPFNFYACAVLLMHSTGVALLFLLACNCVMSVWGGVLFFGLYLSNFQERLISRISALPLRENFALPALWLSLLCLHRFLGEKRDSNQRHYMTLFAAFMWMFLTWQLSLHIVATQLGCLFLMNLFGRLSNRIFLDITCVALCALLLSWMVMFCPSFIITSQLTTGIIAVLAATIVIPSDGDKASMARFGTVVQKIIIAVLLFCLENMLLSLTTRDDSHIITMLLSKLGLSRSTFDSQIYMLGSEFRPISLQVLRMISSTGLFCHVGASAVVLAFVTLRHDIPCYGLNNNFNCYLVLQLIVFSAMAILVSRLRVLALPLLCIFAAYWLLIMRLEIMKRICGAMVLIVALAVAPYLTTLPLREIKAPPFGEFQYNAALKDLIKWVNHNVDPGTPILSDMPTSSALRAATRARLVINPQFEYTPLRRKTHFLYTLGDCNDARWFGKKMHELYHTDLVIVPLKFCTIPRGGGPYDIQAVLALNPLGTCPPNTPYHRRLCNRLWAGDEHFEQLFGNQRYLVFRYRGMDVPANDPKWSSMQNLEHYKPWIDNHVKRDIETGPSQIVSTALTIKRHFNLPVAMSLLQYGLQVFPGNERMLRLYGEALDYDFGMFEEAKKYYAEVFRMLNSRCSSADDLLFYMSYLSHMLHTGTGEDSEILDLIEASKNCLNLRYPPDAGHDLCEYSMTVLDALQRHLGAKKLYVRDIALRFFRLSQDVNHRNECFFNNYKLFNAKDLTTWDMLVMFLTNV